MPLAALQQGGIRSPTNNWNRNKSVSEANLLAAEYTKSYHSIPPHLRDPRRNSVAEFGHHHHDFVDHRYNFSKDINFLLK